MGKVILDTNIILDHPNIFDNNKDDIFIIHATVCEELDNQVHSKYNNKELEYKARRARNAIKNADNVEYIIRKGSYSIPSGWDVNKNDNLLLQISKDLQTVDSDVVLYTNDLLMQMKANSIKLGWSEYCQECREEVYKGYKEVVMTVDERIKFYDDKDSFDFGLLLNEYLLIVDDMSGKVDSKFKMTDKGLKGVAKKNIKSIMFGDLKAKDVYQELAIDSLVNDQFTAITGKAGSGKSLLSLMYSMWAVQQGKYDCIVILYNPTKVRGSSEQGYYSGNSIEKGMQQSIGHMLNSKFGDFGMVDTLISQGKIRLLPMSDCRGVEIRDNEILYITEAQNTTVDLMKICLSRVSKFCKVIIEGDPFSQVDDIMYEQNNGMLRMIEIFKGEGIFSMVDLKNIHRSKIAEIVDKM